MSRLNIRMSLYFDNQLSGVFLHESEVFICANLKMPATAINILAFHFISGDEISFKKLRPEL